MAAKTIVVKCYGDIIQDTEKASGAITPGHLVEYFSTSGSVRVHSTAGNNALPMFALESELEGEQIDHVLTSGEQIQVWTPRRGDWVYALLKNGESVAVGDFLESAGDGTLEAIENDSAGIEHVASIVGQAMEAVDMSDSSGADPTGRILVKIL